MSRTLKIFFHDNCFDGATSAALFGAFYRGHIDASADVALQGVQHKRGDPFDDYAIDGDDNACVDFRYSPHDKMTWWFDHHISAFQPKDLQEHFEADTSGQKFYDPTARSCAKFQLGVLADTFSWQPHDPEGAWKELLHWADIIDGAQFESAELAVRLEQPALRIMTWLEHNGDPSAIHQLIRQFGTRNLADIAAQDWITGPLEPVMAAHRENIELIGERAVCADGVVYFDLSEDGVAAHNKFIAYMLFPESRYTVGVTRSSQRAKISVGSNPWSGRERTHNIAAICERFGGGGHPVVGAVSLAPDQIERAREIARLIRDELAGE